MSTHFHSVADLSTDPTTALARFFIHFWQFAQSRVWSLTDEVIAGDLHRTLPARSTERKSNYGKSKNPVNPSFAFFLQTLIMVSISDT